MKPKGKPKIMSHRKPRGMSRMSLQESPRVSKSLQESPRVSKSLQESPRVSKSLQESHKETRKSSYANWSKNELIDEIRKLQKRKKYGLVWDEEKTKETFEKDARNKLPVLKEITKNSFGNDSKKSTNILIEGDNYHALSVLNYTHKRKIDIIYIDPPYNLGKEFTYNDKLVDNEDSYKHSKWLSFMKKRLKLAKKLLSQKGIIFISIDDNEQAQLKLLCDEIFGQESFIANIIWQKKFSPQNDAKYFSDMHDFILVYIRKKNIGNEKNGWIRNLIPRTEEHNARYSNPDNDSRGNWASADLSAKRATPKDIYPIITPSGKKIYPPKGRSWITSLKQIDKWRKNNRIWFGKNGNNVPRMKIFLNEVQQGLVPTTWWDIKFAGHNQEAKQELKKILYNKKLVFDTPKPVRLIKRILQIASEKNSLILDFFAGSGTLGHTVLELNKEDDGNRQFILCTNNENKICTEVCYPRIKKVIKGYKNSKDEKIKGLGGNLKYFKTAFIDSESTDQNKKMIVDKSTEMLCLKENCFELIKESKKFKIFKNNHNYLGIIYYYDGIKSFKKEVLKLNKKINTYVFSLADMVDDSDFTEVSELISLKPIPSTILNVYRRIFAHV